MDKITYITTKKANGDTRTVADIGKEWEQVQADIQALQPKPALDMTVYEHIAPQLNLAEQERADGTKRTGTFNKDGSIKWGAWA